MNPNRLGLDVAMDLEMRDLWEDFIVKGLITEGLDQEMKENIGLIMRCCWGRGVESALQEPERIIELVTSNGYRVPLVKR